MNRKRLPNWASNVNQTIEKWRYKKFCWGRNDCCNLIYDIEISIYGQSDATSIINNKYTNKTDAIELCKKNGYSNWIEYISKNYQRIEKNFATLGDVGLAKYNNLYSASVCIGSKYASVSENGLVFFGNENIKRTWRL